MKAILRHQRRRNVLSLSI